MAVFVSSLRPYGLAVAAVAVAFLLELAATPWAIATPFTFFFGAVAIAGWRGGFGPGALATLLSAAAVFFLPSPAFTLTVPPSDTAALTTFVAVSLLISWICGRLIEERRHVEATHQAAEAARFRAAFLAEAGAVLASSLDYATRLESLARLAVPTLADWCVVDVVEEDGLIHRLAIVHADPAKADLARRLKERFPTLRPDAEHTINKVLRDGRPWLDPAVDEDRFAREARDPEHLALLRGLGFASEMVVPLVARGRALGTITFAFDRAGGRRHSTDDLVLAEELAGRAALAIDNARLYGEAERNRERYAFLAEAGRVLAGTLDQATVLGELARLATPALADWSVAYLADDSGRLERLAVAGPDAAVVKQVAARMGPAAVTPRPADPLAEAIRTRGLVFIERVTLDMLAAAARDSDHLDALRTIGLQSQVVAPLVAGEQVLGVLSLAMAGSGRRYGPADAALVEEVAGRAALALAHARLYATERRARAEAASAAARYRALFEGIDGAIVVADATGRFIEVNPAASALLGYSRDELLARRVGDLGAGDPAVSRARFAQLQRDGAWHGEVALRRKDGAIVPAESWQQAVALPGATVYMSIWRDISARTAAEAERERLLAAERAARAVAVAAVRARDTFLSIAAHELRTPVTGLKAGVQLLARRQARGALDPARLERMLTTLNEAADRLARLVDDLLDVARTRTGQLPLDPRPLDLDALAAAAVERARERLDGRHRLTLAAPAGPVPIAGDADRLDQVLANLLDNAVKYSPDGGEVAVCVRPDGTGACVSVRDAGIGLPAGAAEAIFAPFGRAANAAASHLPGMGLGLYISRGIVERHGGRIWAESAGEGQGTTVTLWLPAAPAEEAAPDS
jgi:PAS domain S-box-containing protein